MFNQFMHTFDPLGNVNAQVYVLDLKRAFDCVCYVIYVYRY